MVWSHDASLRLPQGKDTVWILDELERILLEIAIEDEVISIIISII